MMSRWDEREKTQSGSISNALLMIAVIFTLGFVVGAIWGYAFYDAEHTTPIPPAFGESVTIYTSDLTTTHQITLYDGISVSDAVTFIKP